MAILNKYFLKSLQGLVYLFPLSFNFGNMIINLFVVLISLLGIIYYNKNLLSWFDKKILILICAFFLIIITSTYYHAIFVQHYEDSIKSLFFLRFLIFLTVIKTMILKNELKLNHFFYSCLIICLFISADIIIQFIFNKNLFGFAPIEFGGYSQNLKYHTGMFGKELIAGGYVQMFSVLGVFSIFGFNKINRKVVTYSLFFFLIILFLITLSLAANRMPLMMFVIFLITLALIIKTNKIKIYFFTASILILLLFSFVALKSEVFAKRFMNFFGGIPNPVLIIKELKKDYPSLNKYENTGRPFHTLKESKNIKNYEIYPFFTGHLPIYITSIDLFLDKPILGRGIKSFRNNCKEKLHLPNRVCESHPHNFTLEILNDVGFLGFVSLLALVLYLLIMNYKDYRLSKRRNLENFDWIYLTVILAVFLQFFPVKSTGSFFSTFNAAYSFLIIGISIGLNELRLLKTNKKR